MNRDSPRYGGGSRRPAKSANQAIPVRPARPQSSRPAPPARKRGTARRRAAGQGFSLLRIAQFASFGVLLFLAFQLGTQVWVAVEERRAALARERDAAESPFGPLPIVRGGQDSWADAGLAAAVERAISPEIGGVTAVYVKSLNTGASAAIEENRVAPSASLFKVPLLVEVLRQESVGLFTLDTLVLLEQRHWADGAGVLQGQIGKTFTVRELLELLVEVSDNVAALALLDLVGADNVNLTLQGNGLEATRLRIGGASRDWGGTPGENTTSAREIGLLLEMIATGRILNEAASKEAMRLLSLEQQASWLPDLLPGRVGVAHKSGELEGVRHDAGVVYTERNQFVVVVLNEGLENYRAAGETISRVARAAYDYLETGKR